MTLKSSWTWMAACAVVFAAHASGWAEAEAQSIALEQNLQVPGATLKAGEYTFSVEDRLRDRAILGITAKDNDRHYLLLAAPNDMRVGRLRGSRGFEGRPRDAHQRVESPSPSVLPSTAATCARVSARFADVWEPGDSTARHGRDGG